VAGSIKHGEIIEVLTSLNSVLNQPVWLFGGVAVDFLVGRWTRDHGDIDVNAYSDCREQLTRELNSIGFRTKDAGWLTHWARGEAEWPLEIVFLERGLDDSGVPVIRPEDSAGVPGRHPTLPGYLDPNRRATLDGVTFRVCSPAGEWLARATGSRLVEGRLANPKIEHDRMLLEGLLSPSELLRLRTIAGRAAMGGP
jgi:hypothetical protein